MIAVLVALILAFAPASTEAPVVAEVAQVQTAQEQALEASAWESLDLVPNLEEITDSTMVEYVSTEMVADGYMVNADEFVVIDPFDNAYAHIFKVTPISYA